MRDWLCDTQLQGAVFPYLVFFLVALLSSFLFRVLSPLPPSPIFSTVNAECWCHGQVSLCGGLWLGYGDC